MILTLAALLAGLSAAALAQTRRDDTSEMPKPGTSDDAIKNRGKSSSSTNTPVTGDPSGRNNPSISTAPDTAPARGTVRPQ
jgi:hypothetical protein